MKKRLLAVLLTAAMVLGMTACGSKSNSGSSDKKEELFELKCFTNCKRLHFKFKKNRKAFTVLVSSYIR